MKNKVDNVLITDTQKPYKTFANETRLEYYSIKSINRKHVPKGLYHIQNVIDYHYFN